MRLVGLLITSAVWASSTLVGALPHSNQETPTGLPEQLPHHDTSSRHGLPPPFLASSNVDLSADLQPHHQPHRRLLRRSRDSIREIHNRLKGYDQEEMRLDELEYSDRRGSMTIQELDEAHSILEEKRRVDREALHTAQYQLPRQDFESLKEINDDEGLKRCLVKKLGRGFVCLLTHSLD